MNEKKSIFSMRNIFKMLSLVCIVITFCPTFLVSCSGQKLDVSAMDLVTGISVYGEKSDPYPAMLIALALPAVIFGIMFMKSLGARKSALLTMVCAGTDTAVWMIVKAAFKNAAEQYYCSFETTGWYTFNMVILVVTIALGALVLLGKVHLDGELIPTGMNPEAKKALDQMSSAVSQMSGAVTRMAGDVTENIGNRKPKEKPIGYCQKCGKPISYGSRFCTSCGTPVPESMIAEAEAAKKTAEAENVITGADSPKAEGKEGNASSQN